MLGSTTTRMVGRLPLPINEAPILIASAATVWAIHERIAAPSHCHFDVDGDLLVVCRVAGSAPDPDNHIKPQQHH